MVGRVLRVVLGIVLVVGGVALGAVPVLPGFPLVALGIALVLAQSEPGRRTLKRLRLWARERFDGDRVREVEGRLPRDVIGHEDTTQMRLDLTAYEERKRRARRRQQRRRDRGRRGDR